MENIKHIMKTIEEPTGSETPATARANNKSGIKFADGKHAVQSAYKADGILIASYNSPPILCFLRLKGDGANINWSPLVPGKKNLVGPPAATRGQNDSIIKRLLGPLK